ncbi:hypothetical protein AVEN_61672-1 [Araneus ventricosus]|uniref:C2H2-type domain-containing protein n=1 Tax=Araneus ventricosus TaxID=182803 RepID=A0A4Y2SCN1_ARAVE|nr:hypothetical protein AVEN_61672-1 [Araneus ventricosus]
MNSTEILTILTTYPTLVKFKSKLLQLSWSQDNMGKSVIYIYYSGSRVMRTIAIGRLPIRNLTKNGKALTCRVCKTEISKHEAAHGENILYECCVCIYHTRKQANLQMHSYSHRPKKFCNICENEHTEGNSNDGSTHVMCAREDFSVELS